MNTRESILAKALEMFNEKGIEYTGVRELAKELGIRVSNISYYFPGKDDLVAALSAELRELNNKAFNEAEVETMDDFLQMRFMAFHNQYKYRCLLISFVHLVAHNPAHIKNYKKTETGRFESIKNTLRLLSKNGYLAKDISPGKQEMLIGHISLLTRFWLSEARITFPDKTQNEVIRHYMLMFCNTMEMYATAKGKKEISNFINTELNDAA